LLLPTLALVLQVLNFKKRYGSAPCNHMGERWAVPERFVARRASPHAPGWEVLVKWDGLGYEHATWEVSGGWLDGWLVVWSQAVSSH
jgi:hypothetical protein